MLIPVMFFVWLMELHYPLAERLIDAKHYDWSWNGWMAKILLRDLVFAVGEAQIWYYVIEMSPVHDLL